MENTMETTIVYWGYIRILRESLSRVQTRFSSKGFGLLGCSREVLGLAGLLACEVTVELSQLEVLLF